MAFVKVVGVVRSTPFVFKALCTSIQKIGVFRVQTRARRHVVGQCAAMPRRRPRAAPASPEDTRRPRSRLPQAPAPRGSSESPRGHVRRRPRRTGPVRTTDRLFVCGAPPYAHRPRTLYRGGISVVTATSPARRSSYKYRCFPLAPTQPLHRAISAAAVELRPYCFPRSSNHPCPFPRLYRTSSCRLLFRSGFCRRRSQAAAADAAGPRRAPTPATSPPPLRSPPGPR
jgi:hypothetical protein